MSKFIKNAAIELAKAKDLAGVGLYLADETDKIVTQHALIAVGSAWIPIPGADIAAMTANVWTMYVRINNALGVKFSDNKMKSIGSAVVSNLVQNLGVAAVAMALKWNPISYIASVAVLTGALYGLTITAGWVYLKALTNMALNDGDIDRSIKETLKDKASISQVYKDNKKK